ncbi:VOC family protein [Bacillus toyonensis]|uniref:VOC family protein n=1 Tax=Bacillus toyonensis TaxID=155322 RepID=UPI003D64C4D2
MNLKMKYIILYVEKFEECLKFYKDTLQLPIKAEHGTYIEFNTGSTILAMNTREDVKELTGLPLTEGELQSSHFELGFVVENVQETIEQFREQGIKVLVEPIVKPWGQTIAYIADPDGNYIEICSSLE